MKAIYTATATSYGGRDGGKAISSDGKLDVKLSLPKEVGGPGGTGTNPEQLFAAGYAACFETILRKLAAMAKKPLSNAAVTAHIHVLAKEGGGFQFAAALEVNLEGIERVEAIALVEKAHTMCPYSNATRGNMDVQLTVV